MTNLTPYVTLMSSLPSAKGLFTGKVPPLSRLKLEKRLQMLTADDQKRLHSIEQVLDWRFMQVGTTQSDLMLRQKHAVNSIQSRTLLRLLRERLEIRTLVLALRMRHQGQSAPTEPNWGFGRWKKHIERHWNEPAFHLSHVYPWATKAELLLQEEKPYELEQLLVDVAFTKLQRATAQHLYDFEAVVIYVLKWNLVNRTVQYNSHVASNRFEKLLAETLHHYKETSDV